jgi:Divergent InlB B-repeat domain
MISPQKVILSSSAHYPILSCGVRFLQILSIFLIFGLSCRVKGSVLVTNLTDLSESAVQAAINTAVPGEEINLPAGTATWTTFLMINNNISLVGAGPRNTIIVDEINSSTFNNTVMGMIQWNTISNYTQCEICGIQFQDGTSQGIYHRHDRGEIMFNGWCPVCHVTECFFNNLVGAGIYFSDGTYGCVDHCQDYDTNSTFCSLCYNGGLCGLAPNQSEYGDMSYANPVQYGSTNNWIYYEYDAFSYNAYPPAWAYDARSGTRVVFRNCTCTNISLETHGTETSGRIRGGRAFEVYDNFFINNSSSTNQGNALGFRSGTGVIYSNILVGFHQAGDGLVALTDFRATPAGVGGWPAWGGANGLNPWDSNGIANPVASGTYKGPNGQTWLTDSSANWTPNQWVGGYPGSGNTGWCYELIDVTQSGSNYYQTSVAGNYSIISANDATDIYSSEGHTGTEIQWNNGDVYWICKSYAHLDQPGRGLCDVIADNAVGSGQPYDYATGKTNWPNQQLEPWYQWDNTNDGVNVGFSTNIYSANGGGYPNIMYQRDYYDNTVMPEYTPLAGPHPLDNTNSISFFTRYNLTVSGGTGSGLYTNNAIVSISGNQTSNQSFAYWSGADIANTNQANTTVTMPASDLTVTAYYAPYPPTGVTNTAAP